MDKRAEVAIIKESIRSCTSCDLRQDDVTPVPMAGPLHPKILVIGHGPGKAELAKGLPFVGKTGRYTKRLFEEAGIPIGITTYMNIVCCGDNPKANHILACRQHCQRQQQSMSAEFTLVLGLTAGKALLDFDFTMKQVHGLWGRSSTRGWQMLTFHPASVLHAYAPQQEMELKEDIAKFAKSVLLADLAKPKLHEYCIRGCGKMGVFYVNGLPFCNSHCPPKRRPKNQLDQLSLF